MKKLLLLLAVALGGLELKAPYYDTDGNQVSEDEITQEFAAIRYGTKWQTEGDQEVKSIMFDILDSSKSLQDEKLKNQTKKDRLKQFMSDADRKKLLTEIAASDRIIKSQEEFISQQESLIRQKIVESKGLSLQPPQTRTPRATAESVESPKPPMSSLDKLMARAATEGRGRTQTVETDVPKSPRISEPARQRTTADTMARSLGVVPRRTDIQSQERLTLAEINLRDQQRRAAARDAAAFAPPQVGIEWRGLTGQIGIRQGPNAAAEQARRSAAKRSKASAAPVRSTRGQ